MADRILNTTATLYVDFPGQESAVVSVDLTNPVDELVRTAALCTHLSSGRYYWTETGLDTPGIWRADFSTDSGSTKSITFSVGERSTVPQTKWDLRTSIARRIDTVFDGVVMESDYDSLTDETLIGGAGNYIGWWITFHPDNKDLMGKPFRVRDFNGSSLVVAPTFPVNPPAGTPFTLSELSPREVDKAILDTFADLSGIARIPIALTTGLTIVADEFDAFTITLPRTLDFVQSLYIDGAELAFDAWEMRNGRRLIITDTNANTKSTDVQIIGQRKATAPAWDDSFLDFDGSAIIPAAAATLHAARARGQGTDLADNLRRQLAAQDVAQRERRRVAGRNLSAARKVIE